MKNILIGLFENIMRISILIILPTIIWVVASYLCSLI